MAEVIAKRRRSSESLSSSKPPQRDCYHEVTSPYYDDNDDYNNNTNEEGAANNDEVVYSSWLKNVQWISSSSSSSTAPTSCGTASTDEMDQEDDCSVSDTTTSDTTSNDTNIRSEIRHNLQQLLQVKRRLGPAAERSTEAFNSRHHTNISNNDTTTTRSTTGRLEFEKARRACNPFEALGEAGHDRRRGLNHHLFMNRSAIKLANIDAALGFVLTTPPRPRDSSSSSSLVFADLCGAPGGFSEYVLWRCCRNGLSVCRGYGMSLTGSNEQGNGLRWKLEDAIHRETNRGDTYFSQFRVCYGEDGTGDIYKSENVQSLQKTIRQDDDEDDTATLVDGDRGRVDLVSADGGFDAQRDAENQEEIAQKLVVCEAAAALTLLRKGGSCVVKMFGFQSTVIRSVLRHLFFAFDHLVAIKPISSRPASAERYVVCTGFHGNPDGWDSRQWCNQMFMDKPAFSLSESSVLFRYLDEFDSDLSSLNLKACFAILSFLEMRCNQRAPTAQESDSDDMELGDDDDRPRINVAIYKYAWRLDE